jgi:hypothetical protein
MVLQLMTYTVKEGNIWCNSCVVTAMTNKYTQFVVVVVAVVVVSSSSIKYMNI